MDITFRPANPADEGFLFRLFCTGPCAAVCYAAAPEGPMRDSLLNMQFMAQKTHYDRYYGTEGSLLVETEEEAIGRMHIHEGESDIRIVDMLLMPDWRGRGIGSGLISELFRRGRATNRTVSLAVENNNPRARSLYERMGFLPDGENDGVRQNMIWRP